MFWKLHLLPSSAEWRETPTLLRMPPSEMSRRVALVRTDVSEECIASIIRVIRIGELGTRVFRLLVTANVVPTSPILVALSHTA
jgi:hypothetical protein